MKVPATKLLCDKRRLVFDSRLAVTLKRDLLTKVACLEGRLVEASAGAQKAKAKVACLEGRLVEASAGAHQAKATVACLERKVGTLMTSGPTLLPGSTIALYRSVPWSLTQSLSQSLSLSH